MSEWHISDVRDAETGDLLVCGGEGQSYGLVASVTTPDHARLIAAAPALLEVLLEMFCEGPVDIAMAGNPTACADLERRARAAISRATGATDD